MKFRRLLTLCLCLLFAFGCEAKRKYRHLNGVTTARREIQIRTEHAKAFSERLETLKSGAKLLKETWEKLNWVLDGDGKTKDYSLIDFINETLHDFDRYSRGLPRTTAGSPNHLTKTRAVSLKDLGYSAACEIHEASIDFDYESEVMILSLKGCATREEQAPLMTVATNQNGIPEISWNKELVGEIQGHAKKQVISFDNCKASIDELNCSDLMIDSSVLGKISVSSLRFQRNARIVLELFYSTEKENKTVNYHLTVDRNGKIRNEEPK